MIRQPAVAGQFYPGTSRRLRDDVQALIIPSPVVKKAIGAIAPHAGYIYSGGVAGHLFGLIHLPRTVVILGPNHYGVGTPAALYPQGEWLTPLGSVQINEGLAALVKQHVPLVHEDASAHQFEHSLEVQVPFLQHLQPELSIVPLCLGFSDFARCSALGKGLAAAIREYGEEVLILASSDMTHYQPAEVARREDEYAIREVLAMNPEGLLNVCRARGITMCGVIPAVVMLVACLELGATAASLEKYATSGDVTGDNRKVVAYAAFSVT